MAQNVFNQQYYTDMVGTFGNQPPPSEKKKRTKRDATDPGDPVLEKSLQPDTEGLHTALMKMQVTPETQTPWEIFKYFYDNAQLAKVFAVPPIKPSEISPYQMAAALMGDANLRVLLLPDPDGFIRQVSAALLTLREMHKSDPRVRNFNMNLAHIPGQ